MTATLRHLGKEETDLEFLLLGASSGAVAIGCAWFAFRLPRPRCAFHAITGCPCPTCGATRCLIALLHGRLAEAVSWNPMVFAAILLLTFLNLHSLAVLIARLPRLRFSLTPLEARILRIACVLLAAANWSYEIHHRV